MLGNYRVSKRLGISGVVLSSIELVSQLVKRIRRVWRVARVGEKRNAYRLLVGKPEGRRPLGRPRRRRLDNIRMDLVEVGWGDVGWIGLAQDGDRWRGLVNSVLNLRVPIERPND
jgi:hypothetical protein